MFKRVLLMSPAGDDGSQGGGGVDDKEVLGEAEVDEVVTLSPEEIKAVIEENKRLKDFSQKTIAEKKKEKDEADRIKAEKAQAELAAAEKEGNIEKILKHERDMIAELKNELQSYKDEKKSAKELEMKQLMIADFKKNLGQELIDEDVLKLVPWGEYAHETLEDGSVNLIGGKKIADNFRKAKNHLLKKKEGNTGSDAPAGTQRLEGEGEEKSFISGLPETSLLRQMLKK